jgi:hypothetical protein
MSHHKMIPAIDGISFDDMWEITHEPTRQLMCARGLVWAKILTHDGTQFGGTVIANCFEMAKAIADARGLGEVVLEMYQEAKTSKSPLSVEARRLFEVIDNCAGMHVAESDWPAVVELVEHDKINLGRIEVIKGVRLRLAESL